MSVIPAWAWGLAIAACLGLAGVQTVRLAQEEAAHAETREDHAEQLAEQSRRQAKETAVARATEFRLAEIANHNRSALDEKIASAHAALAAARDELRQRPARPAAAGGHVPAIAGAEAGDRGCTGAGLYRDDGQFLAGEAHLASIVRAERDACYASYNAAREALRAAYPSGKP